MRSFLLGLLLGICSLAFLILSTSMAGASPYNTFGWFRLQPPQLSSVAPTKGSKDGGTLLTLTGRNFVNGMSVKVGGVACGSVSSVTLTSATCVTAAAPSGRYDVSVGTQAGVVVLARGYRYK